MSGPQSTFDYIIVGAGSAGSVLTNRLSEDRDAKILLLEAGRHDRSLLLSMPLGVAKVFRDPRYNWSYQSEPEHFLDGRRIEHSRGKTIGGSSAINAMAYVRGHRADYDRLPQLGLKGWSYADVLPYFKRLESYEAGENSYRGSDGPWHVRRGPYHFELFDAFREAGQHLGYPKNEDYNGADQVGFAAHQHTIHRGRRWGNAAAFLHPALRRKNVRLETSAHVTRLLLEGDRVVGLEYSQGGRVLKAYAARDVILAGGAFNSPHLLMLSGIGPAEKLKNVGIKPIVDLPGVGQNLWDHPMITTVWSRIGESYIHRNLRYDRLARSILKGIFLRRGFACEHYSSGTAFVFSDKEHEIPDLQLFCRDGTIAMHEWFPLIRKPAPQAISINCAHLRPESRGEVDLISADPRRAPRIVNNFLSSEADRRALRQGYKTMCDLARSPGLKELLAGAFWPSAQLEGDQEIDSFIRSSMQTVYHPGGTCKIGTDSMSVVDIEFRVNGTQGLRVIDASVLPLPIGGNINAAVTVFADKASDLVRGLPGLSRAEI
ncbi:GMC family oxidoreductase [Bradyrhizobium mercantei]|uniref:GMC family oxidoreductase n=1 Tax=Bradyrhizobium mercantei TaxID=1904807 RepID=UPI000975B2D8|nr:GMC family oxidoreductase N-terminal domain-containing protein [Bradyrhizobium mercantei]